MSEPCRRCGGRMLPGRALAQTFTAGAPDFPGDRHGMTYSPGGPGKLVACLKCIKCGWSVSPAPAAAIRQPKDE